MDPESRAEALRVVFRKQIESHLALMAPQESPAAHTHVIHVVSGLDDTKWKQYADQVRAANPLWAEAIEDYYVALMAMNEWYRPKADWDTSPRDFEIHQKYQARVIAAGKEALRVLAE